MAMTTATGPTLAQRLDELRKVPSQLKGFSLEPLFTFAEKTRRLRLRKTDAKRGRKT